ncbi:hypothetical protein A3D07_01735 [Candidatus Curtissbacteria bacterium RIFCSPHIGHO2_02_FULL_42_15]|uniref:Adenylate kinase n=1 Tax=Candidatus Curtissbacteria bacterium RIFCSPHIGHO2_02_FULL_42_15 TaxID=1797716 RepID=A0A1F5GGD6_9BACT|nr:MAG: hypothetical protein A3D07_01735 [Candidatus Curtissbacteria bacterium RIFCSPHIGHO2_02_FULL_42_15]
MKIIFLGIQGSGKSTQAKIAAEKLSLPYIETSQLLREKSNGEDEDAKQIANAFEKGNLVVDEITIRALKERLKTKDCQKGYILDGYPRNEIQFQNLDSDIGRVFYVKVSDEEAIRRLSKRARHDDTGKALKRRMDLYHRQTEPVLDKFREKGILEEVDGERSIKEIAKDIESKVLNYAKKHAG